MVDLELLRTELAKVPAAEAAKALGVTRQTVWLFTNERTKNLSYQSVVKAVDFLRARGVDVEQPA